MLEKIHRRKKYQTGRPLLKIEEDGKSWLRRPKLYKGVVEPYKKKNVTSHLGDKVVGYVAYSQCVGLSRLGIRKHQV